MKTKLIECPHCGAKFKSSQIKNFRCSKCHRWLPKKEFYGRHRTCKQCAGPRK